MVCTRFVSFSGQNVFETDPVITPTSSSVLCYSVGSRWTDALQFVYPFTCSWTLVLFLVFAYYGQSWEPLCTSLYVQIYFHFLE